MTTLQILAGGGLFTAIGALLGIIIKEIFEVLKRRGDRVMTQKENNEKINEAIELLREEMRESREERSIICYALSACLDGLIQNGANGPVSEAKNLLEKHLNKSAHRERK